MASQPSFANLEADESDFEQYLGRGLEELAKASAAKDSTKDNGPISEPMAPLQTLRTPQTPQTTSPSPIPKATSPIATTPLSAFPPKPRPALLVTVPPSPPSKAPAAALPAFEKTPTPTSGPPPMYEAAVFKATVALRPKALRMSVLPDRRQMASSTKRLSFSSQTTTRRQIKYGKTRHAVVELVPQPSDDPEDPLNWPAWKKEANYWVLLLLVCLVGVMKTALVTVNSQLATAYSVSYTAAAALTGVPLMVSALAGFVSLVAARFWGKRPLYLASAAVLLVGTLWSTGAGHSYGQCMAARVLQGLGWGTLDVLVLGSIHDTFFEHERCLRETVYDVVAVGSTWGGPLLGGVVSSHRPGYTLQFVVLGSFLAVAVVGLVVAGHETTYDRSSYSINTPVSAWSNKALPLRPRAKLLSVDMARTYLGARSLRPAPYRANVSPSLRTSLLLQAPRAMLAPTTVLLGVVSLLPFCALWGITAALSLFFAPLPFDLSSRGIGALLVAPFFMATAVVATTGFVAPRSLRARFATATTSLVLGALAAGTLLFFVGLLALGLYMASCATLAAADAAAQHASVFTVASTGAASSQLKLPVVSFVLGLLAAGAYVLDATVRPVVRRSTQFTSSNLAIAQRNTVDMCAGVALWRTVAAGAFVVALPNAVWLGSLLKATSVGIVVAQALVAATVAAAWWRYDEAVRRLDGQVMRCVDLGMLKRTGSFFDTD